MCKKDMFDVRGVVRHESRRGASRGARRSLSGGGERKELSVISVRTVGPVLF